MHFLALALAFQGALIAMPDAIRELMPGWATKYLGLAFLFAAVAGRLIDQTPKDHAHDDAP